MRGFEILKKLQFVNWYFKLQCDFLKICGDKSPFCGSLVPSVSDYSWLGPWAFKARVDAPSPALYSCLCIMILKVNLGQTRAWTSYLSHAKWECSSQTIPNVYISQGMVWRTQIIAKLYPGYRYRSWHRLFNYEYTKSNTSRKSFVCQISTRMCFILWLRFHRYLCTFHWSWNKYLFLSHCTILKF